MKNTTKILGLLLFIAIIGFSFAACKDDSDELDGTTWKATETDGTTYVLTFNSPNFTMTMNFNNGQTFSISGKYSIDGNTVTMTTDSGAGKATLSGNTLKFNDLTYTKQ